MKELILFLLLAVAVIALYILEEIRLNKAQAKNGALEAERDLAVEYREKFYRKWLEALDENTKLDAELRALKNAESEVKTND